MVDGEVCGARWEAYAAFHDNLLDGYGSVVYRDSTIATLKMIKDDDDNLETALDVVATHIKKECLMMDYKHQTYHTNTSKEIAEESAPANLQ